MIFFFKLALQTVTVAMGKLSFAYSSLLSRGVHQITKTTQSAKNTPKPPAKWHNRTAPQVTVCRIAPHCMMQCGLQFNNPNFFKKKKRFDNPNKC